MDLPEILTPEVGEQVGPGFSANDLDKFFNEDEMKNEMKFSKAYEKKLRVSVEDLSKFLGIVARLHSYINAICKAIVNAR